MPETRAAYRAVLAGETRFFPKNLVSEAPVTKPAWATLPGMDVDLVGREGALRQLEQAYARVRMGHGRVVLISGESRVRRPTFLVGRSVPADA